MGAEDGGRGYVVKDAEAHTCFKRLSEDLIKDSDEEQDRKRRVQGDWWVEGLNSRVICGVIF